MEDTGRVRRFLSPFASKIVFGASVEEQIDTELPHVCAVDQAHILMLSERGIVSPEAAARVLTAILELEESGFAPLRGRPASRGLFLMYEDYLIERCGASSGGVLQTGRSRNDLSATVVRLRARPPYLRLVRSALLIQCALLRGARRWAEVVMPAYTHGQAAMPVTYGHYLAAVAEAIARDIDGIESASKDLDRSPLGAASVAGTSLKIDPAQTAELLGFSECATNSIDAVASRDFVLRLLAAVATFGTTLSRFATDLLTWTTAEFAFLLLPDTLIGSSSAMPQKRNPFLLEHVQGRSASGSGAFVASLQAMQCKPFTNSIAVGTEAIRPLWAALNDVTEAATLLRLIIAGARPQREIMRRRTTLSFCSATALADRLVIEHGWDFRSAHRAVGDIVRKALENGISSLEEAATRYFENRGGEDRSRVSAEAFDRGEEL